jgi:hypothetical protein
MNKTGFILGIFALLLSSGCNATAGGNMASSVLSALSGTSESGAGLDSATVAAGLKEALAVGSERAVASTSARDGFWGNEEIKIPLPEELNNVFTTLRTVGFGSQVDALELNMNRAAEQASAEAKPVLLDAVKGMSLSDAMGILRGGDTAATEYFRAETSDTLKEKFLPIIQDKMAGVGLYQQYNKLMDAYAALPLTKDRGFDLDNYVADKGLDGLFSMLAREEAEIRENPAARSTELLQKVFASH